MFPYLITSSLRNMGGQPPARGPDPAHEGLASGPPPCSAITLQSGPRNPSQKNAGFMNDNMRHVNVRTKTKQFGQCRESRCKLRRPLISSRHWLMRSQCSMAICLKFCVRSSLAESKSHAVPCVFVCVTCRRRSPPFFVSSSTRDGSLA